MPAAKVVGARDGFPFVAAVNGYLPLLALARFASRRNRVLPPSDAYRLSHAATNVVTETRGLSFSHQLQGYVRRKDVRRQDRRDLLRLPAATFPSDG